MIQRGSPVKQKSSDTYGVAVRVYEDAMDVTTYDGLVTWTNMISAHDLEKISKNELAQYLERRVVAFEKEIEVGGNEGAIASSRQFRVGSLAFSLRSLDQDNLPEHLVPGSQHEPRTDMYVAMGIYSGQGPSDELQGIYAPEKTKKELSDILLGYTSSGLGKIPSDIYNTPATSHGSLVCYWLFPIPKYYSDLVENPLTLKTVHQFE